MAKPEILQKIDTELYADSAEWCPFPGLQDVLLCGTYQLLESEEDKQPDQPQVRVGQLQVYRLTNDGGPDQDTPHLSLAHCLDMPGVLDIKWARQPLHSAALAALVNAKGELHLWRMGAASGEGEGRSGGEEVSPECLKTTVIAPDCIGLSLDWAPPSGSSSSKVVTSDSKGGLTVFEVSSEVTATTHWCGHDYEAWICAFDQWNPDIIYSGSDDCKLKVWDQRVGETPVLTNSRFTMGVCSIQSSPLRENLLAVGSYDENIRLFDTRKMRHPLSEKGLGGGVWRVKWDPVSASRILTATMHNGFHIVDCSNPDSEPLPMLAQVTENSSLGYGADWCWLRTEEQNWDGRHKNLLVASCSFYDHTLQLWECPT